MYELGADIYYFRDNRVHSAPVLARMIVDNLHEDWAHTAEQKDLWTPWGKGGVYYRTCHGIFEHREVFGSKQELLDSM